MGRGFLKSVDPVGRSMDNITYMDWKRVILHVTVGDAILVKR